MAILAYLTNNDSHELGWIVGKTYMVARAHSQGQAIYDTILGYDIDGFVTLVRKQHGHPDLVVTHITHVGDRKPL